MRAARAKPQVSDPDEFSAPTGYFRLTVPVGTYQVVTRAPHVAGRMIENVAVTRAAVVNSDLGIQVVDVGDWIH
jgi:hypothetical protein